MKTKKDITSDVTKWLTVTMPDYVYATYLGRGYTMITPELSEGSYSWVDIYNTKDSDVDLYINKIRINNFSTTSLYSNVYINSYGGFETENFEGNPLNTNYSQFSKAKIRYYQGDKEITKKGTMISQIIINPNITDERSPLGSIIVGPGTNLRIFVTSNNTTKKPHFSVGMDWAEIPTIST